MMKSTIHFILISSALSLVAGTVPSAFAAEPAAKKTTVNFEDQLVEGQASKPDLLYMLTKKNAKYKKLIRLRENFLPELRQTSNEIAPTNRKAKEKKP